MFGFFCQAMVATSEPLVRSHSAVCSPTTLTFGQYFARPALKPPVRRCEKIESMPSRMNTSPFVLSAVVPYFLAISSQVVWASFSAPPHWS